MNDVVVNTSAYPSRLIDDLAHSGLVVDDLKVKPLEAAHKAALQLEFGVEGYGIPYFDWYGKAIPYYRAKLYDAPPNRKYRQPPETPNYVYFAPGLRPLLDKLLLEKKLQYIVLTEGEKKAARCIKAGIPCIGLGGVDSWKSRTIILPKDTALSQRSNKSYAAKLPSGSMLGESIDTLSIGLQDVIDFILEHDIPIVIIFDSDDPSGPKLEVRRAAAQLAFELRFRGTGIKNIRTLALPNEAGKPTEKVGLDDYLQQSSKAPHELHEAILRCLPDKACFPKHPNMKEYVNKKMSRTQMPRAEQMQVAMAVLADLDARGTRLLNSDADELYYFEDELKALHKAHWGELNSEFAKSPFGRLLYKQYGLSINDARVLGWLTTLFSGEDPILPVSPQRVLTWKGDTLYYQINDGSLAKVTKSGITLHDNGTDSVLFESGMTEGLSDIDFKKALTNTTQPTNWWYNVLRDARVQETPDDRHRRLLSLLYYVSPFFYRWRGTQLPVEITTGEAGSGKSTLFELRLSILTGVPKLRNAPSDLKDWSASLATTGALHVTDNVQMSNNDLRQKLSDELCRLVTEPRPSIEQRKLYTNTGLVKIPVQCVFGITAIKQPFTNVDIIQRSIITELDKGTSSDLTYDADWKGHQLRRFGGQAEWLVHHLKVVQGILKLVELEWDQRYKAKYRLINVEQLLMLCDQLFGSSRQDATWIPLYLEKSRDSRASETDWALEGLGEFVAFVKSEMPNYWINYKFTAVKISQWAVEMPEYKDCNILSNSRSLGRYINQHKNTVATITGIINTTDVHGKTQYALQSIAADTADG